MCVGIPMEIIAVDGAIAHCTGRGRRERIDVALVGALAAGDWILAHQGRAVRTMTPHEAAQTNAALDALEKVLAGGGDLDAYFADLVAREPQLPPHLRKTPS